MDMFRKLNEMENSIRRGDAFRAFKPLTEKMGEPVIMGGDDSTTPAGTDDSEKCASLMSALHMYDSAKIGGVKKCNTCGCEKDEVVADMVIKPAMEDAGEEEKAEDVPVANQGETSAPAPDSPMADDEDKIEDCVSYKEVFGADADEEGFRKSMDEAYEKAVAELTPEDFVDDEEGEAEVVGGENNEEADAGAEDAIGGEEEVAEDYTAKSLFGGLFEKAKDKSSSRRDLQDMARVREGKAEAADIGSKKSAKPAAPKKEDKKAPAPKGDDKKRDKRGKVRGEGIKSNVTASEIFGNKVDTDLLGGSAGKGRTHRQRRQPGEIWMGRYGVGKNPDTMVAWTKWEDTSIVRVKKFDKDGKETPEFQKLKEAAKGGWTGVDSLGGKKDEKENRRSSKWVKKIPEWADRSNVSESAWKRFTEWCAENDFKPTKGLAHTILGFKTTLGARSSWGRSQSQLKHDFVDGMDKSQFKNQNEFNAVKARIDKMTPQQFEVMMHSINSEEEDDVRSLGKYNAARSAAGMGPHGGAAKSFDTQLEAILKSMN